MFLPTKTEIFRLRLQQTLREEFQRKRELMSRRNKPTTTSLGVFINYKVSQVDQLNLPSSSRPLVREGTRILGFSSLEIPESTYVTPKEDIAEHTAKTFLTFTPGKFTVDFLHSFDILRESVKQFFTTDFSQVS
jgi:hypothetical protein